MNGEPTDIRKEKSHAFPVLDGLRGIAAIAVMLTHYSMYTNKEMVGWVQSAYLAVDFFFVLSGFVVAHAYEKSLLSGKSFGWFMTRRLIRLYPLYWFGLTLSLVTLGAKYLLEQSGPDSFPVSYIFSIFLLPTPHAFIAPYDKIFLNYRNIFPLDGPAWSLSLEIGVNIIYALICRKLTMSWLAVFVALSGFVLARAMHHYYDSNLGWDWHTYAGGWTRVVWSFFGGILLYRLFRLKPRMNMPGWIAIILAAILMSIFARPFTPGWEYGLVNCLITFPLLVWIGAKVKVGEIGRIVCAWLGRISYALYIIHMPLLPILIFVYKYGPIDIGTSIPLTIAGWAIPSIAVAIVLDILYDAPIRAFLTKKLAVTKLPARSIA